MKKLMLMTKVRRRFAKLLKNREGQSTTEYILILAIVVMLASKVKSQLGKTVEGAIGKADTAIQGFDAN